MYPHSGDVEMFADVIPKVMAVGGSVAGVMHSTVEDTGRALDVLREHWSGPLLAYPESGEEFTMPIWHYEENVSAADLADACENWVAQGVQIVGGCCGTRPEHIRAVRERMPARLPS
jgi:homocysteine S-methyltransferase